MNMEARLSEIEPRLLPWQVQWARDMLQCLKANHCAVDASDTGLGKSAVAIAMAHATGRKLAVVTSKWARPQWRQLGATLGFTNWVDVQHWEWVRLGRTFGHWHNGRTRDFVWDIPPGEALIVFDEIHAAGGINTLNSKLVIAAKKQGYPCIGLSATVADTPLRMKALGYMLGLYPHPNHYYPWITVNGCAKNKWNSWEFHDDGGIYTRKIHSRIFGDQRGVRVRKDSIKDFPECIAFAEAIDCDDATNHIQREYNHLLTILDEYTQKLLSATEAREMVLRARQRIEILKIPAMVDIANSVMSDGGSPVFFVNFRETAIQLSDKLHCGLIIGGLTQEDYNTAVSVFMSTPHRPLVCTYDAGSESINLQDKRGDSPRTGVLLPTYRARSIRQAEGRINRAGGRSTSTIMFAFAAGTVETEVLRKGFDKLIRLDTLQDGMALPLPLPEYSL